MGLMRRLRAFGYDRMMASTEREGLAAIRRDVLARATGNVLEIGAGTGANLQHYPPSVTRVTLTEPDPSMLRRLAQTAEASERETVVLRAPAEDLPFEDATFDTVVSTLVLCGVEDQPRAVHQVERVLKPGGRFLFVEHLRSTDERCAHRQDRINWLNRFLVGCECNRPTLDTIERSGLRIDHITHGELPKSPEFVRPMIHGEANRSLGVGSTPDEGVGADIDSPSAS